MGEKTVYDFKEQLKKGQLYEDKIAEYFGKWYNVEATPMPLQRLGIDLILYDNTDGRRLAVEVKADEKTAKTNNVFIETYSAMEDGKEGWGLTSQADVLVYVVVPNYAICLQMAKVQTNINHWRNLYGERTVKNKNYTSAGIPVPLWDFKQYATLEFTLN